MVVSVSSACCFFAVPYHVGTDRPAFFCRFPAAALEDPNTGVVSWESGAIMNYVRRVYDKENKLGPRGSTEQHIVDFEKWEYFLLTTLGPFTGQTNWVGSWRSLFNLF